MFFSIRPKLATDWYFPSQQQFANSETRNELKLRFLQLRTSLQRVMLTVIMDAIVDIIGSRGTTIESEFNIDGWGFRGLNSSASSKNWVCLGVGMRLRNQNVYNFFVVILSLLALASNLWKYVALDVHDGCIIWQNLDDKTNQGVRRWSLLKSTYWCQCQCCVWCQWKQSLPRKNIIRACPWNRRCGWTPTSLWWIPLPNNNLQVPVILEGEDFDFERG